MFITRLLLTLHAQRDGGLQPLAGGHRPVPHHTPELGAVVVAARRHRQRAGRLVVLGAALADRCLQRHSAAHAVPAATLKVMFSQIVARQASTGGSTICHGSRLSRARTFR